MKNKKTDTQEAYCKSLFSFLCSHREEIDGKLRKVSSGWKPDRIPKTDLAVLRVAICELSYMADIPEAVSVNEAVELAKKFGTGESAKYVNGVLGRIIKEESRNG